MWGRGFATFPWLRSYFDSSSLQGNNYRAGSVRCYSFHFFVITFGHIITIKLETPTPCSGSWSPSSAKTPGLIKEADSDKVKDRARQTLLHARLSP